MKRVIFLSFALLILILSACSGSTEQTPPAVAEVTESPAPVPTEAPATPYVPPTPVEPVPVDITITAEPHTTETPPPTPSPSPTPVPTPSGLIGGKYKVFTSGDEEEGEEFYKSKNISITVRHCSDSEHYKNYIEYHVADIYIQDITLLRTGCAGDSFNSIVVDSVPNMAKKYGAILAVSGDYYAVNVGLVVRNGVMYSKSKDNQGRRDVCVIYRDGTVKNFVRRQYLVDDILKDDPWQVFNFGPALLDDAGKAVKGLYLGVNANGINPRCIFGYYEPGHYALIVIDGRNLLGSRGLDIDTLAKFAEDQGFKVAYNLDGGNSAVMCWKGELFNNPSYGGRSISDIIYLAREGQDNNAEPANTEPAAE